MIGYLRKQCSFFFFFFWGGGGGGEGKRLKLQIKVKHREIRSIETVITKLHTYERLER